MNTRDQATRKNVLEVADERALRLLDATQLPDGTVVVVRSTGARYTLDRTVSLTSRRTGIA